MGTYSSKPQTQSINRHPELAEKLFDIMEKTAKAAESFADNERDRLESRRRRRDRRVQNPDGYRTQSPRSRSGGCGPPRDGPPRPPPNSRGSFDPAQWQPYGVDVHYQGHQRPPGVSNPHLSVPPGQEAGRFMSGQDPFCEGNQGDQPTHQFGNYQYPSAEEHSPYRYGPAAQRGRSKMRRGLNQPFPRGTPGRRGNRSSDLEDSGSNFSAASGRGSIREKEEGG